jgi:hypothetical protein
VRIFQMPIDGKTAPKFLKVSITNFGKFPLHISSGFFYWKVPFKGEVMQVWPPVDLSGSPLIPPKHYPTEISPRTSASFTISDMATKKDGHKALIFLLARRAPRDGELALFMDAKLDLAAMYA